MSYPNLVLGNVNHVAVNEEVDIIRGHTLSVECSSRSPDQLVGFVLKCMIRTNGSLQSAKYLVIVKLDTKLGFVLRTRVLMIHRTAQKI